MIKVLKLFDKSFAEYFSEMQGALAIRLEEENIEEATIQQVLKSGFLLWKNTDTVYDGYYWTTGAMPYKLFISILKGSTDKALVRRRTPPVYSINSLEDAEKVLELPQYKKIRDDICFRGQVRHFSAQRPYPHPFFSDSKGYETLLLPGYWRKFVEQKEGNHVSNSRPIEMPENFLSILRDRLHYYGIDVAGLRQRNLERYGFHSTSEVEDFPDAESQEFARRYKEKVNMNPTEQPLLEQHYGFPTVGLDVTFDLKTALFFATNRFQIRKEDGKANYKQIKNGHEGVIYLLRFTAPKLMKTRDMISSIGAFDHIPPIRPIKQTCAIPFFLSHFVNEAAAHIIGILKIGDNFNSSDLYNSIDLFPSKETDPFYRALLELKKEFPEELESIADYDFTL